MSNYLHFSIKIDQLFFPLSLENLLTGLPVIQQANMEAGVDFHKAKADRAKPEEKEGFGPAVRRSHEGDCQQRSRCGQFEVRFWGCRLFLKFSLSGN